LLDSGPADQLCPIQDEERKTSASRTSKTIVVEHVRIAPQRPFAAVRAALEFSLSKLDVSIPEALREGDRTRAAG
jgi:hypothetical protein